MRKRSAVRYLLPVVALLALLAPVATFAAPCTAQFEQDVSDCYAQYSGILYQMCLIEADARWVGCIRGLLLG